MSKPSDIIPDDPREFLALTDEEQSRLCAWIVATFQPSDHLSENDSYAIKHHFERSPGAFYVTNGQFKGAMLKCGFLPVKKNEKNWRFRMNCVRGCLGRLRKRNWGTTPCWHEPHLESGLCSYHETRKSRGLPIVPETNLDRDAYFASQQEALRK